MSANRAMGLVAAGSGVRSFVSRMPGLPARLGPVKGASYAAARKLVESLGAGYAIPDYAALEGCEAVWVLVPERELDAALAPLATQAWVRRIPLILCQTARESGSLELLRGRGARVATLNAVDESRRGFLAAEGHAAALRPLRRICAAGDRPLVRIRAGTKTRFFAGIHLATDLLRPWVEASMECLRSAGLTRAEAAELTAALGTRSWRSQVKAGNPRLGAPARATLRRALQEAEKMAAANAPGGALYAAGIRYALQRRGG